MSEAERELLRDLWRKRERRGKRLKKWMVFPSVYLFTFLECERFLLPLKRLELVDRQMIGRSLLRQAIGLL